MKYGLWIWVFGMFVSAQNTQAAAFSLPNIRSMEFVGGQLSVDAGISLSTVDFIGGRVSYSVSDRTLLFADAGLMDFGGFDSLDGPTFGGGILRVLDTDTSFRIGLNGDFHYFQSDYLDFDFEISQFSGSVVASGKFGVIDKTTWYCHGGLYYRVISVDSYYDSAALSDTDIGLGAGLIYAYSDTTEIFVSFDIVNRSRINMGVRWYLGRK